MVSAICTVYSYLCTQLKDGRLGLACLSFESMYLMDSSDRHIYIYTKTDAPNQSKYNTVQFTSLQDSMDHAMLKLTYITVQHVNFTLNISLHMNIEYTKCKEISMLLQSMQLLYIYRQ